MPLLDHFHPPLVTTCHWESFQGRWAAALFDLLNDNLLPPGYFAEMQVRLGTRIEVDIATLSTSQPDATATSAGRPTAQRGAFPIHFPESVEVLVRAGTSGPARVAAIELVSPSNKDRPESRQAFAIKCADYLHQGCGPVLVDVVSIAGFCLQNNLAALPGVPAIRIQPAPRMYVSVSHPQRRDDQSEVEFRSEPLAVGDRLPTVPLFLRGYGPLPIDLEATYHEACVRSRIVQREQAS